MVILREDLQLVISMFDHTLIHYPHGMPLPPPWQPNWHVAPMDRLSALPGSMAVARAPRDTPVPNNCEPYVEPVVTDELRKLARHLCSLGANAGDQVHAELCAGLLNDADALDREIRAALGTVHPYALFAPLSVETLDAACHATTLAASHWTSPCSCAVIRCAERGYHVWTGLGGMMRPEGQMDSYEFAEAMATKSIRHNRKQAMNAIRSDLDGWHPDTPFHTATLATAATELPWTIRRGPMTTEELPSAAGGASSWDLPIVAEFRGTEVIRHNERVTWSDEESRERALAKQRAGEARRKQEIQQALSLLSQNRQLAPLIRDNGLRPNAEVRLFGSEKIVYTVGPVKMYNDKQAVALVRYDAVDPPRRQRIWLSIEHFAE